MTTPASTDFRKARLAFIGGGNMANAILGGLIRQGLAPNQVTVIEPFAETAAKLKADLGVEVHAEASTASSALAKADLVVWAVKPQVFKDAALPAKGNRQTAVATARRVGPDRLDM